MALLLCCNANWRFADIFASPSSTASPQNTATNIPLATELSLSEDEIARLGQRAAPATPGQRTIEDLLFAGGDTSRPADSAATQAEDTVSTRPTARPFTALLNTGDVEGSYLVATEDVESIQSFLALGEVQRSLPRNVSLTFETQPVGVGVRTYRRLYVLDKDAFMTGEALENAIAGRDPQFNQSQVQFELNRAGGRRFAQFTAQHVGDYLAIVLDNQVMSAPVIRDRIGARGQIVDFRLG